MRKLFNHGYALLIGVGTCDYDNWSLPVTVKDAHSLYHVLTDPDSCAYSKDLNHVRVLHNTSASRQSIENGLVWLQAKTENDEEATAVVYFSGHGWLNKATGEYFLIPSDVSPFDIPGTAISATNFSNALKSIPAKRLLVIIDSCHAEGMATAKNVSSLNLPPGFEKATPTEEMLTSLKQGEGRAVFTSSRGTQKSWVSTDKNLSIYTFYLIKALRGTANKPGEFVVTISNLMQHLSRTVPVAAQEQWQADQVPFFDMATEDFPVALLMGGKGLSSSGTQTVEMDQPRAINVQITGGGNIVGSNNVVQTITASDGSTIRDVNQIASSAQGFSSSRSSANHPEDNLLRNTFVDSQNDDMLLSIYHKLVIYFNLSEIKNLCFSMDFNYENIRGETLEEKARELILFMYRRNRLQELIQVCSELRPTIKW